MRVAALQPHIYLLEGPENNLTSVSTDFGHLTGGSLTQEVDFGRMNPSTTNVELDK